MASTSTGTAETPPPVAPNPTLILFARGVIACLELWPALRIAIEQGWGDGGGGGGGGPGPSSGSGEKRRLWLASEIVDAFDNTSTSTSTSTMMVPRPDVEYIALMLGQVLEDEFDARFEDGSVEGVAEDIVGLWGAGEDVVGMWERKAEGVRGKKVDVQEEVGSGDGDEWEDEESDEGDEGAPQLMPPPAEVQRPVRPSPIIDENGFTLVQKRRS